MPTPADLLAPFLFLVGNIFYVDITFLDTLVEPLLSYTSQKARTLKTCYDNVRLATGDEFEQGVFLKRNSHNKSSLMRRDCFDLLVLTGPHKMFTWNDARIRYILCFYPSHPVPGYSPGRPCSDLQHHASVMTMFPSNTSTIPMMTNSGELKIFRYIQLYT
jgi:hypothetical protein